MTFPRQSNHARRASRARELAERSPASAEPLSFIAAVIAEQSRLDTRTPRPIGAEQAAAPRQSPADLAGPIARLAQHSGPLIELVLRQGPPPLRDEAQSLDEAGCREALDRLVHLEDTTSTRSFFARVLLQAVWASNPRIPRMLTRPPGRRVRQPQAAPNAATRPNSASFVGSATARSSG